MATHLRLYDLTLRRTVAVAGGVGLVFCRGDVVHRRAYGDRLVDPTLT
ncbi:hypothetical protein [Micromonospora sp. NPDC006431]